MSLEELNTHEIASGSSVVSLTEFDQQYFEARSASKLEALKTLWRHGHTVLWATRGARHENPYSAMILGLSRCIRYEQPHLNLQVLDFDIAPPAQVLAEELIRLELGERWKKEGANLLWTVEPEVHHVKGQVLIPRLRSHGEANKRYNTYRRDVQEEVNPRETTVSLQSASNGRGFDLATVSPLRFLPAEPQRGKNGKKLVEIRVDTSLLQVLRIGESGFLNLCAGEDTKTGESLLALVNGPIESHVRTPVEWAVRASEPIAGPALGAVAAHILAQDIIAVSPPIGSVLVHEADETLKDALEREAARQGVRVVFTTLVKKTAKTKETLPISSFTQSYPRLVQKLIPSDVSLFVDLSSTAEGGEHLARCLPHARLRFLPPILSPYSPASPMTSRLTRLDEH